MNQARTPPPFDDRTIPLHGCHEGVSFAGQDLRGRIISGTYIRCDFTGCDLRGASLIGTFIGCTGLGRATSRRGKRDT